MAVLTLPGVLLTGNHASRPSSGVGKGTLYACSTHTKVYQTTDTGATWVDWFDAAPSGSTFDPDTHMPWNIDIVPVFVKANTNWSSIAGIDGTNIMNFGRESTGAQNAEVTWDVALAAGTWRVDVVHIKGTDRGIISVQFDSVEKGTIDTYNGSLARNQLGAVTGITVATTAKVELKLKMATKNASSSSYYGTINLVTLRRTA